MCSNFITSEQKRYFCIWLPMKSLKRRFPTCLSDSWASQVFSSMSLRWVGGASRTFMNRSWAWRPQCWQMPFSTSSTRERMYVWLERNWNSSWHLWVEKDKSGVECTWTEKAEILYFFINRRQTLLCFLLKGVQTSFVGNNNVFKYDHIQV